MDGKQGTHRAGRRISPSIGENDKGPLDSEASETATVISVELLQRLVQLLDQSDVSELEFRRAEEGTHLVLRKVKLDEHNGQLQGVVMKPQVEVPSTDAQLTVSPTASAETKYYISSHLVGIFHVWAKPRGGTLVAVGDHVKEGQLVATIESLNVINDVESPVAGRVVEILTQEGQPVEYGQKLMVIDSSTGGEGI